MTALHTLRFWSVLTASAALLSGTAQAAPQRSDLVVDQVVMLMRHGVRPPTKAPPMPAGTARDAWPGWSVPPGWLTPHGAGAVERLGEWDAARFRRDGVLPASGCPAAGAVHVYADSDQRTIATAEAWLAALAPGCSLKSEHRPQDEADPIFNGIEAAGAAYDPARADAAVRDAVGPGGIAAIERRYRPLLDRLDAILCGEQLSGCGISRKPSSIAPAGPGKRPKLGGALDSASTAAQILLLEYADGMPAKDVGWGRANAKDVEALSAFHALEFRLLAQPRYIAKINFAPIAAMIDRAWQGPAKLAMISGHDTDIANLGGLLGVHWRVPGLADDDPSPGGAFVLTRLHDRKGQTYVRVSYRSQTVDQIRSAARIGTSEGYEAVLTPQGCSAGLCTQQQFAALLSSSR